MFDNIKDPWFGAILQNSHFSLNFAHIAGAFFFLCAPLVLLAPKAKVHKNLKDKENRNWWCEWWWWQREKGKPWQWADKSTCLEAEQSGPGCRHNSKLGTQLTFIARYLHSLNVISHTCTVCITMAWSNLTSHTKKQGEKPHILVWHSHCTMG